MKRFIYYASAFLQGMALVILPASSFIFKSPQYNALSDQQYGLLFLPVTFVSILITLRFEKLLGSLGRRKIYFLGLAANMIYILMISATVLSMHKAMTSFLIILSSEFFLGAGFGLFVAVLNILTIELNPARRDAGLTGLHGCLGAGSALSPLWINYFHERGLWITGLLILCAVFAVLAAASVLVQVLPVNAGAGKNMKHSAVKAGLPFGALVFLFAIAIYAVCEATLGNWSTPFLTSEKGFSPAVASAALSLFWLCVTIGRLSAPILTRICPASWIYRISPLVIAVSVLGILSAKSGTLVCFSYILAGIGCANFFPLSISLSTSAYDAWRENLSSLSILALMLGTGAGSYLVGFFRDRGWISLASGFGAIIGICVFIFALSIYLTRPPERSGIYEAHPR